MSKQYTRSEVASSNNKEKTLIIIHDKVYDVTAFLNEHPGGEEVLLDHGGKDASVDFDDVGHSQDAFNLMKKYVVGELVESERSNTKPKANWSASLKTKQENTEQGLSPIAIAAVLVVLAAIAYYFYL